MTVPFNYQTEDVARMHKLRGRVLNANAMGTGKSFESLLFAQQCPDDRPIVIVCPASLKWNWQRECTIHIRMPSEILEGTKPHKHRLVSAHQITIINYDILRFWLDYLEGMKPKLIILDETHFLQSRKSQRTKAVQKLCQGVPKVLALSGTPLVNRPAELWPTLNILRPDLFPSFFSFAFKHCGAKKAPWGWEFKGASRLKELNENLNQNVMIRHRKEDILKDLPQKRRAIIPVELDDRKEYDHALDDFLGWLAKRSPAKLHSAARAERLVRMGYLKRLAGRLKLPVVYEWLDGFLEETDEKLIVFALHRKVITRLHDRYENQSVVVDGSTIGHKRQLAFDKFLSNKKTRILIGNIKAAGVGWSAKGVSTTAFVELAWNPGTHSQAEDRTHGINRGKEGTHSLAYYLIARNTIESNLLKIIQEKSKVLDSTLDGTGNGDGFDVFDRLHKELLQNK